MPYLLPGILGSFSFIVPSLLPAWSDWVFIDSQWCFCLWFLWTDCCTYSIITFEWVLSIKKINWKTTEKGLEGERERADIYWKGKRIKQQNKKNKQTKKFQRVMKINFILSSPEVDIIFRTHGMATQLKGERLQVTFRSLKELYRINYTSCTQSILYWKPNFSGEHTSLKLVKEFELPTHTLSRNLYTTKQFLHAILS